MEAARKTKLSKAEKRKRFEEQQAEAAEPGWPLDDRERDFEISIHGGKYSLPWKAPNRAQQC